MGAFPLIPYIEDNRGMRQRIRERTEDEIKSLDEAWDQFKKFMPPDREDQ